VEKRFAAFIALSVAIWVGFLLLQMKFAPPRPQQKKPPVVAKKQDDKAAAGQPDKGGKKDDAQAAPTPENGGDQPPDIAEAPASFPQRWVALGSADPHSSFRMLAIFNSRGAAIERIELSSDRYRDLEDSSGYLGHLALTDVPGTAGCQVNVVGRGTPAEKAGLRAGDTLIAVDGKPIKNRATLQELLRTTRPGQQLALSVDREEGGNKLSPKLNATLQSRPLEIIRPEPVDEADPAKQDPLSCLLTLQSSGEQDVKTLDSLRTANWETKEIAGSTPAVEFRLRPTAAELKTIGLSGPIEIVKRYRLQPVPQAEIGNRYFRAYHLTLEIELINLSADVPQEVVYRLDGPNGLPHEGWWYSNKVGQSMFGGAGVRDVIWATNSVGYKLYGCPTIFKNATKDTKSLLFEKDKGRLKFIGVDAQYFTSALMPDAANDQGSYVFREAIAMPAGKVDPKDPTGSKKTNVTFRLTSLPHSIEPGQKFEQRFTLFAGPKEPELVAAYGLENVIEYGWFWWVSKPLVGVLDFFYLIVRNYGLAIIMLTVLVRGCMFPLSRKAAKNMQATQELAPEMKKIKEKYKNDMQKQGEEMKKLYAKHNFNPLGGCWMMFIQLPIFLGLYRALSVDIVLREAPLIPGLRWCSNLAGPDMLLRWDGFLWEFLAGENGYLGPYLNVLPIVTVVLFLVQQKLFTPPATDEQTAMTQKMMTYMMVFMGVLFFKVPSGLCIYFITSSIWGIAERLLLPKTAKPGEEKKTTVSEKKSLALGSNGSSRKAREKKKQKRK
jgi:YidC/Oxa1 family membrane protein insertase